MSRRNRLFEEKCGTSISLAADFLRQGRIVAFPTETYYGLGVDPDNEQSISRLFHIKKRPSDKPLLLLVADKTQLESIVDSIPEAYHTLIDKYWPGPLTLIFPAKQTLSRILTAGSGTIGVRISPHPIATGLVESFRKPITATSANISGMQAARTPREVFDIFGDTIDYILDGGVTKGGLCSTVAAAVESKLAIIRKGEVTLDETLLI